LEYNTAIEKTGRRWESVIKVFRVGGGRMNSLKSHKEVKI
jgi:hypothetical protein